MGLPRLDLTESGSQRWREILESAGYSVEIDTTIEPPCHDQQLRANDDQRVKFHERAYLIRAAGTSRPAVRCLYVENVRPESPRFVLSDRELAALVFLPPIDRSQMEEELANIRHALSEANAIKAN